MLRVFFIFQINKRPLVLYICKQVIVISFSLCELYMFILTPLKSEKLKEQYVKNVNLFFFFFLIHEKVPGSDRYGWSNRERGKGGERLEFEWRCEYFHSMPPGHKLTSTFFHFQ